MIMGSLFHGSRMSSLEEHLIKCINYYRQYGKIEYRYQCDTVWQVHTPEDGPVNWNIEDCEYRIPSKYPGPRGSLVWSRVRQEYEFCPNENGEYVRWEDYQRDCTS